MFKWVDICNVSILVVVIKDVLKYVAAVLAAIAVRLLILCLVATSSAILQ